MGSRLSGSRRLRLPLRVLSSAAVVILVAVAACPALGQQVPTAIAYQGRLTDNAGQPVADGAHQVQFKLYTVDVGGAAFWTSTVNVQTSGGLFTTRLEPITPADLSGKTDVWIEVWVGSPLSALSPRVKLASAPFALRADDLSLPFSGTVSTSSTAFSIYNTGTGQAGRFQISNTGSASIALYGRTDGSGSAVRGLSLGTGQAGYFQISNAANASPAAYATTNGIGNAGSFEIANVSNSGDAVYAGTNGIGHAGYFQISNAANASPAVYATTNGTGPALKAEASYAGEFQGRVYVNGNVGIGVSPASTTLDVNGQVRSRLSGFMFPDGTTQTTAARNFSLPYNDSYDGYGSNAFSVWNHTFGSAVCGFTTGLGNAVYGEAQGGGSAGYFRISNASPSDAVYATTIGSGAAVKGYTSGTGRAGYFQISNAASASEAVYATTSGSGDVIWGQSSGVGNAVVGNSTSSGNAIRGLTSGSGWAGMFTGNGISSRGVYISAPVGNTGLWVASGTKSAVVATSAGARLLYTEESTEVWFTDYGFGKLENGRAKVAVDPAFAETVDLTGPYHVFVQLNDLESAGVGVVNKSLTGFEVGELRHGKSNAEFSYRIVARRKNYANARLERAPYADNDPNLYPEKRNQSEAKRAVAAKNG